MPFSKRNLYDNFTNLSGNFKSFINIIEKIDSEVKIICFSTFVFEKLDDHESKINFLMDLGLYLYFRLIIFIKIFYFNLFIFIFYKFDN